jgi:hypothetical protein
MRALAFIVIAALAIDTFAFSGRYRDAAWQTLQYQADHFSYGVHHFVKKTGY